jgi:hypothetical protein
MCRAYPVDKDIPRLNKLWPRADIGYLVGYDSSNIFRIWIPAKNKVIATRDVTFDETKKYDPSEPILIEQLQVEPELMFDVIEVRGNAPIGESHPNDQLSEDSEEDERHDAQDDLTEREQEILTPDALSDEATDEPSAARYEQTAEVLVESSAENAPEDIEPNLMTPGETPAPGETEERPGIQPLDPILDDNVTGTHAAFAIGMRTGRQRLHTDKLPREPKTWKEMLRHPMKDGFMDAARLEYQTLMKKGTMRRVEKTSKIKTIPLKWVFNYKFDTDGYLLKFKARICVRGDLQESTFEDTRAATLAARTFTRATST